MFRPPENDQFVRSRVFVQTMILALVLACGRAPAQTATKKSIQSDTAAAAQKKGEPVDQDAPVRQVQNPGVITTNQNISPAGVQSVFETRVYGVTFGASSREIYAAVGGGQVYGLDWQSNKVLKKLKAANPGLQGLSYDPVLRSVVMTAVDKKGVGLVSKWDGAPGAGATPLGKNEAGQVAVSRSGAPGKHYGVVALTFDDEAAIIDMETGSVLSKVRTGIAPFGAAIDKSNSAAYISNWGGRFPNPGDLTSTTGSSPGADRIVVDARGAAGSGTISRIDLKTGTVTAQIEVGLHPTSIALDDSRGRLYVSNSNSDSVSVVDTEQNKVIETISLQPFARNIAGVEPESLVLSGDGRHLYVACAGINAVAVLELKNQHMKLDGVVPTGWYPDSIALSPDEKYLGVGTLLGVGSGWKHAPTKGPHGCPHEVSPGCRYVHSYRGAVYVLPVPERAELSRYSAVVAENNRVPLKGAAPATEETASAAKPMPVPLRAGDPSPIKHIIYIIKENRTYDQYFGGLGKGNGDPSLQVYGEDVVPNQRKLAREFVLLDNFYATGGNSADGHQWLTQANETDYTYLPGYAGRSYPFNGNDPMAVARGAFIWNAVADAGKSFIDFGEYAEDTGQVGGPKKDRLQLLEEFRKGVKFEGRFSIKAGVASLNNYLAKDYPTWDGPDVIRAQIFNRYVKQWESEGDMPALVMADLPWDHTAGTRPGFSTPRACVADNDYALGMMVEAVTHSKFWPSTLILVVEDDAQDGVDHVDGHRTVALAISPYVKRGAIDSTFYSHPSMLKTIELILGLRNLSIFDQIANDMRNSFQDEPNLTPYSFEVPAQSIYEANPPLKTLTGQARRDAEASLRMNFSGPDAAPTEKLNRILWRDAKGLNSPYPKVTHAVFAPYSNDLDDDEKEALNRRK